MGELKIPQWFSVPVQIDIYDREEPLPISEWLSALGFAIPFASFVNSQGERIELGPEEFREKYENYQLTFFARKLKLIQA